MVGKRELERSKQTRARAGKRNEPVDSQIWELSKGCFTQTKKNAKKSRRRYRDHDH